MIAHLAALHQRVERAQRLLDRGLRVEAVQGVDVDVVGIQAAQAGFAGAEQMMARRADVVRVVAHAEGRLGRDDHLAAATGNRLAENFLGDAVRVNVGGVEHGDARVQANVDEARRFVHVGFAPRAEEIAPSAERRRAEAEYRDFEAADQSRFHDCLFSFRCRPIFA